MEVMKDSPPTTPNDSLELLPGSSPASSSEDDEHSFWHFTDVVLKDDQRCYECWYHDRDCVYTFSDKPRATVRCDECRKRHRGSHACGIDPNLCRLTPDRVQTELTWRKQRRAKLLGPDPVRRTARPVKTSNESRRVQYYWNGHFWDTKFWDTHHQGKHYTDTAPLQDSCCSVLPKLMVVSAIQTLFDVEKNVRLAMQKLVADTASKYGYDKDMEFYFHHVKQEFLPQHDGAVSKLYDALCRKRRLYCLDSDKTSA